jgi:FMN phosphatase YigB (HAD superfamily)
MKAAIFDVDGTLCDVSSIRYHVNPKHPRFSGRKRFDRFHADAINCPPHPLALDHYRYAKEMGWAVLVVTARKSFWAMHTLLWLREHGVEHDELYMRRNLDNRKDVECKREILADIRRDGYRPILAVDDNPAIIELWRSEGIPTVTIPGWED